MSNKRKWWHLKVVMAWGYTLPEAFALCKREGWFETSNAPSSADAKRSAGMKG